MSTRVKMGSSAIITACTARVNAIGKYLTSKDTLFVQGVQVKATDLAAVYQDALDTRASAVTAKGAYKSALAARNESEAKRLATDTALEAYVVARFGATSTEAQDFGYAPKKVTQPLTLTKAKSTLLNAATRLARGTMSEKEKRRIKGALSADAVAALNVLTGSSAGGASSSATPPPAGTSSTSAGSSPVVVSPPVAPAAPAATGVVNGQAHS